MFVGVIVSPYNRNNPLPYSQITCLVISDETSSDGSYRKCFLKIILSVMGSISVCFKSRLWREKRERVILIKLCLIRNLGGGEEK